jgi:hypothetical protein
MFYSQHFYFGITSPSAGEFTIYISFNKEKPKLSKNHDFDGGIHIKEEIKKQKKYKYVHRIKEILNDSIECH